MLGVGFEPTHPKILELESSALDRSAIQAIEVKPKWGTICEFVFKCFVFLYFSEKKKWSIRVSIPVPRACKARTLPIELMPQKTIPGGTWTPNILIRSQTPCPIGPQGLGSLFAVASSILAAANIKILRQKKGTAGIEPATAGSAIPCSTAELSTRTSVNITNVVSPRFCFLFFRNLKKKVKGAVRELNPRPLAPEARIIPLDQRPAISLCLYLCFWW